MKKSKDWNKVLLNALILLGLILAIAVASHFLLRAATRHGARSTVPEFKGISLREAQIIAAESDLNIFINDSLYVSTYPGGTVLTQLPKAGVEVKPGRTIYVVISAYGKRMMPVPYVAGRSLRQAKNMLEVSGFEISRIKYVADMATNYVLEQSLDGRKIERDVTLEAPFGSGVELTVGVSEAENPYTRIPNLIGLTLKEAKSRIWESGLNVGRINIDEGVNLLKNSNARVYLQGVEVNSRASWGSTLSVRLTLDQSKIDSAIAEVEKQIAAQIKAEQERAEQAEKEAAAATEEPKEELDDEFGLY